MKGWWSACGNHLFNLLLGTIADTVESVQANNHSADNHSDDGYSTAITDEGRDIRRAQSLVWHAGTMTRIWGKPAIYFCDWKNRKFVPERGKNHQDLASSFVLESDQASLEAFNGRIWENNLCTNPVIITDKNGSCKEAPVHLTHLTETFNIHFAFLQLCTAYLNLLAKASRVAVFCLRSLMTEAARQKKPRGHNHRLQPCRLVSGCQLGSINDSFAESSHQLGSIPLTEECLS